MSVTVITPTADRPIPFSLCENWMRRQTIQPDQWIVADGGSVPVKCTMGQTHLHDPRPPGAENLGHNLLNAIAAVKGDMVAIVEDDDWYRSDHLALMAVLLGQPYATLAGVWPQLYYHVGTRLWRSMPNKDHSSLCATAMKKAALPTFAQVVRSNLDTGRFHIDFDLWRAVPKMQWARAEAVTVVGMKGLSGQAGLGIGHWPNVSWSPDPRGLKLRTLMGEDAQVYESLKPGTGRL